MKDIHKRYGKLKLKNYPTLGLFKILYCWYIKKLKPIPVLNYMDYKKFEAKGLIMKELGWKDYGVKHGESTFTKFYQAYILPKKFNIDKRKAHLSNLIQSGQITREEALNEVKKDVYTKEELEKEKRYVLKKFDITETEFQRLMNLPNRDHSEFKSEQRILEFFKVIRSIFGNR